MEAVVSKSVVWGHPLMGSRALSVESAEEGAELAEEGAVGEVNLSDFCRYYQQPTNNTPELALQIGSGHRQCGGAQCGDSIAC